ncbi:MAG: hypothetical protein HY820_12695 [Acidobacteria bacterium]|nr:hypothetical protein [Acidobacteriota bacterium]
MKLSIFRTRRGQFGVALATALLAVATGTQWKTAAQTPPNLTPGMLFGPLYVAEGQHVELCASFLGEGALQATVHFRNLSTGEVSGNTQLSLPSGGGECAAYQGKGHIVGLARGDGAASDWVSPTNALISSMAVVDDNGETKVSVQGVAKIWVRGL